MTPSEVAKLLPGVPRRTVADWQKKDPAKWKMAVDAAKYRLQKTDFRFDGD